jgi:hypothetical protein
MARFQNFQLLAGGENEMTSAFFSSADNNLFPAKNKLINTGILLKIYITYRKNSFGRFLGSGTPRQS